MGESLAHSEQKVAIITGATSGIGVELAKHLHGRGYNVAVAGRRVKEGKAVASDLDPSGNTALFVQCDVASYASQAKLFQTVWNKWSRLDVLMANAGIVDKGSLYNFSRRSSPVTDLPAEPDLSCTDIDFKGTIYGTTLATHFMRHNPGKSGGKIIVTGSMIGVHPCPTFPEYCAAKAGVHHFVRTMAPLLLEKEAITINCVMPGGVETPVMPNFSAAFLPEHLTLMSCLLSAYDIYLDDEPNRKTGQTVETAHDKLFFYDVPEHKSGDVADRNAKVYEPWFTLFHGEKSSLDDALQSPPKRKETTNVNHSAPTQVSATVSADTSSKIIVVTGATGSQGGGVVNVMKKTPGWKVRAITRNPGSEAARKLVAEGGVEVVQASFDDEASLASAFDGAHAVFAVTNWWEHLFSGKSQDVAGEIEEQQGMRLARAAAKSPTLEHYVWSTTPSAKRVTKGEHVAPHLDYKANVDARIKSELPELAKKTTYLYFGYYPQNLAFFPLVKPIENPATGQWLQILPTKPDAKVLLSGDMTVNPGIWVRQAIATTPNSFGKYANVAMEKWTFQEMLDVWSEITGKSGFFLECSLDTFTKLWGPAGNELGLQFKFGELCDPWEENEDFVGIKELGIDINEVVGFRGTIEGLKHLF